MSIGAYILDGHEPVPIEDIVAWAQWYEVADRVVAQTTVDTARVSTIFLGLDYNFMGTVPLIFETMVFGGPHNHHTERYSTWEQAKDGHTRIVAALERKEAP